MCNINRDEVRDSLINLIDEKYIKGFKENEILKNKNFFGKDIKMFPSDVLNLFFDIEKCFNITIPEDSIISGKFNSFNNVLEIIMSELELMRKETA